MSVRLDASAIRLTTSNVGYFFTGLDTRCVPLAHPLNFFASGQGFKKQPAAVTDARGRFRASVSL